MANPHVTTTIAHADPNASPITINELIDTFNPLISTTIGGSYIPYVISSDTPGSDDRDKAWIEVDTVRRPLSIKVWHPNSGAWRRVYNGMLGEVRMYFGNPGYTTSPDSDFDPDGHGHIGGRYDGWQICNGKNGSPDFSNREPCGADMTGAGGGFTLGHWRTNIDGQVYDTGGQWSETLDAGNIPFPTLPARIPVDHYIADGYSKSPAGGLWGEIDASADKYLLPAEPGNPTPTSRFTGDPFFSAAWIIFQGY